MDSRNIVSRRTTIKSALALAAATAIPAVSLAAVIASDERLHQLMSEWRAEYDAVTSAAPEMNMDRLWAIEREAAAIRPVTLEGFAIKLLLLTNFGEFDLDSHRTVLLAEAEAIAGYAPPVAFGRS